MRLAVKCIYRGFWDLWEIQGESAFQPLVAVGCSFRTVTRPILCHHCQLFRLLTAISEFAAQKFQRCTPAGNCLFFPCDILRHGWCHVALICDRVALSVPTPGARRGVRNAAAPLCAGLASMLRHQRFRVAPDHLAALSTPMACQVKFAAPFQVFIRHRAVSSPYNPLSASVVQS